MRRKELLNLCWDDISISGESSFVCVRASITKNGKEAGQPIPTMVVNLLKALKTHTRPKNNDRVFPAFKKSVNMANLIRDDLKAAGLPLFDRENNEIVFCSLRNSYISFLANNQTHAKVVQKLARHSDMRLTFNTYARTFDEAEIKAVTFLPNFGNFVLSTCLDKFFTRQDISKGKKRQKNSQNTLKTAFLAVQQTPRVGLEPTT